MVSSVIRIIMVFNLSLLLCFVGGERKGFRKGCKIHNKRPKVEDVYRRGLSVLMRIVSKGAPNPVEGNNT